MMIPQRISSFFPMGFVDRKEALAEFEGYLAQHQNSVFVVSSGNGGGRSKFLQALCDRKVEEVGDDLATKLGGFVPLAIGIGFHDSSPPEGQKYPYFHFGLHLLHA